MSDTTDTVIVIPGTGAVVELDAPTEALAGHIDDVNRLIEDLIEARRAVEGIVIGRLDAENARSDEAGPFKLTTNAPTEELYDVGKLTSELRTLVEAGKLSADLLGRVITYPPPSTPAPRVDKREVNKLKRSADADVLTAVARARTVQNTRRTLKVERARGEATR